MSSITSSYRAAENLARQGFKFYRHNEFSRSSEGLDTPISSVEAVSRLRQERFDRGRTWDSQAKVRITVPDGDAPIPVVNEAHLEALDQLYSDQPLSPPTRDQDNLRTLAQNGAHFRSGDEEVPLGQLYWRMAGARLSGSYHDGESLRYLSVSDDIGSTPLPEPVYPVSGRSGRHHNLAGMVASLDTLPDVNELSQRLPEALQLTPMRHKDFVKKLVAAAPNPVAQLDVLKLVSSARLEGPAGIWAHAVSALPLESAINIGLELVDPKSPAGAAVGRLASAIENVEVRRLVPELIRLSMERPQEGSERMLGRLYERAKAAKRLSSLDPLLDELMGEKAGKTGWKLPDAYVEARFFCKLNPGTGLDPRECLAIGARFRPEGILFDGETVEERDIEFEEDLIQIGDHVLFLDAN